MHFDKGFFRVSPFKSFIDVFLGVETLFSPYLVAKNVWVEEKNEIIIIKIILPGFKKEHIDIRASEEEIYVKAEKLVEDEFEKQYWRKYIRNGKIVIKWEIPMSTSIEPSSGEAKIDAGVLTIKFKKKVKGEKVPIG